MTEPLGPPRVPKPLYSLAQRIARVRIINNGAPNHLQWMSVWMVGDRPAMLSGPHSTYSKARHGADKLLRRGNYK